MQRTTKVMGALFALDVFLFALSGIPMFRNADSGVKYVIGGIGWFGFLLVTLVLIVLAVTTLLRRALSAGRTA